MNQNLKRLIIIAMLLAIAIVINYVESFIPVIVPGVKLGLANVIILLMIYEFKFYEALIVDILRIFVVSLIRGTLFQPIFFMALFGGLASYLIMLLFSKIKIFSAIGTSALGAIFHTFGQIIALIVLISTPEVINYIPIIGLFSLLTGILSGFICHTYLVRSITSNYVYVDTKYKERYILKVDKEELIIDDNKEK